MPSTQWNATVALSAKVNNSVPQSFQKATTQVQKLEKAVEKAKMSSIGFKTTWIAVTSTITAAIEVFRLGVEVVGRFGEALKASGDRAFEFDKRMNRIHQYMRSNIRTGWMGKSAPMNVRESNFKWMQDTINKQATQSGIRPDVLEATYQELLAAGMTRADIEQMAPGIADTLVAKDINDTEQAGELGKSLGMTVMKNRPLHMSRKQIGMALGIDEKAMKAWFAEDADPKNVEDRAKKVGQLMEMSFGGMAKYMNQTEEGIARTSIVWKWMFDHDLGEEVKNFNIQWDRFVNWIAPALRPVFDKVLIGLQTTGQNIANYLTDFWNQHGQSITYFWNNDLWPKMKDISDHLGSAFEKFSAAFLSVFGAKGDSISTVNAIEIIIDRMATAADWLAQSLDKVGNFFNNPTFQAMTRLLSVGFSAVSGIPGIKEVDEANGIINSLTPSPKAVTPNNGTTGGTFKSNGTAGGYNAKVWDDYLAAEEKKYGLRPGLLRSIARQEGVAAGDLNPLGISPHGGNTAHYVDMPAAMRAIDNQAALISSGNGPYAKYHRTGDINDLANVYSPVGAANDVHGTNGTEGAGIKKYLKQFDDSNKSDDNTDTKDLEKKESKAYKNSTASVMHFHFHGNVHRDDADHLAQTITNHMRGSYA